MSQPLGLDPNDSDANGLGDTASHGEMDLFFDEAFDAAGADSQDSGEHKDGGQTITIMTNERNLKIILAFTTDSFLEFFSAPGNSTPLKKPKPKRNNPKIHACSQCTTSFSSLRSLGDHLKIAHKMKGFKCDSCEIRVTRYDNLTSHRKTCSGLLSHVNDAGVAPAVSSPKRRSKRRVCMRDIDLHPEPIRPLPKPTSYNSSVGQRLIEPSEGEIGGVALGSSKPYPDISQSPNLGLNIDAARVASDPGLEIQRLRTQLATALSNVEMTQLEVLHWKKHYFELWRRSGGDLPGPNNHINVINPQGFFS
ncbi:hypothetical protein TWF191_003119 [Orbilia oligospora]|uniref:C2H2-type domain-containing protein n=1 Tax=Orbilia oligospora TaxID=2813651 RepID=A0A7C8QYR5_ORBOL|nr:hypothetical protein TWF191_003119 [Orbilia oligospora]